MSFSQFRLSYYPHRLAVFKEMLQETFGTKCKHTIYGDFKLLQEVDNPDFYIHVMEKLIWLLVQTQCCLAMSLTLNICSVKSEIRMNRWHFHCLQCEQKGETEDFCEESFRWVMIHCAHSSGDMSVSHGKNCSTFLMYKILPNYNFL